MSYRWVNKFQLHSDLGGVNMPSERNTGGRRRRKEGVDEFDSEDDRGLDDIWSVGS